jgi:cytochrome c-type biogenesis protein CcmH
VVDFLVSSYGEFVLLKPRVEWRTALLWALPPGILPVGVLVLWSLGSLARRRSGDDGNSPA